jgi:hypothetical protein
VDRPSIGLTKWVYEYFFKKTGVPAVSAEHAPQPEGAAKAA